MWNIIAHGKDYIKQNHCEDKEVSVGGEEHVFSLNIF